MTDKFKRIEIERVANGFVVRPPWNPGNISKAFDPKEVHVFETFENLVEFLRESMEILPF